MRRKYPTYFNKIMGKLAQVRCEVRSRLKIDQHHETHLDERDDERQDEKKEAKIPHSGLYEILHPALYQGRPRDVLLKPLLRLETHGEKFHATGQL